MKIETIWQSTPRLWLAIDSETYDGAPDSKQNTRGVGATEREAINDLLQQLEEV